MKTPLKIILILVFAFGFTLTQSSVALSDSERVIIVLDASGSMWGQIQGKTKIEIAREVIADLMADWDSSVELGLMAYGHRRKGDCTDIEMLIPVGKDTANRITQAVNTMNPKGKTPLSDAVKQAAMELKYTEDRATVILVSDGIETCEADPCEVGAELAMTGTDFTAHVVGFDVTGKDQDGLRCLAENTGGVFLAASNASELQNALKTAVKKVKDTPVPIAEEPGDATVEAPEEVSAGSEFEVIWTGPDSLRDFITVVRQSAPEGQYMDYAYTHKGSPATLTAPPESGEYEVRYVFGSTNRTLAKTNLIVSPVKASVTGPQTAPAGSVINVEWTGPDYQGDYITIVLPDASPRSYLGYANTHSGNPVSFQTPDQPGQYEIRYIMNMSRTVLATARIEITAVSATVITEPSVNAGAEFQVEWTGPDNPRDYITIVPKDAPDSKYLNYAYTSSGSPVKIQAPDESGDYEVRYILDQSRTALARTSVELVSISATVEVTGEILAGQDFQVIWTGPDYPRDYITIVPKGAADSAYLNYAYTSLGSPATIKAPDEPGEYEVRYILDQSRTALKSIPVTVN